MKRSRRTAFVLSVAAVAAASVSFSIAPAAATAPAPANGRIAYDGAGIAAVNPDGRDALIVTGGNDHFPAWSPDGTKIAFSRGPTGSRDIYAINADGTALTQLTTNPADDFQPAWSPDGSIAFVSDRTGDDEIWTMSASDGSAQANLSSAASSNELSPTYSPDGASIAFTTNRDGDKEIYTMHAAGGGGVTNLTDEPNHDDVHPNWSPDGTQIVYEQDEAAVGEIFVMSAVDGSAQTDLTNSGTDDANPTWAPDGSQIAFVVDGGLHVMDPDGTGLADLGILGSAPDWQPLIFTVSGTSGDDPLSGTAGNDVICG
ncbi:MAG: TolB protein, partial [Actinomycetota bacterium]|nr:TolB protein [Actinomycetota bacterium]